MAIATMSARWCSRLTAARSSNWRDYRGEASLFGWMCQICRNAIADLGRHRQRMVTEAPNADRDATIESFLEALSAPLEDEPESQVLRMDLIRLVQSTLDCLPSHYGDVLEWKYVDGLALEEIATRLELGSQGRRVACSAARAAPFARRWRWLPDRAKTCRNG